MKKRAVILLALLLACAAPAFAANLYLGGPLIQWLGAGSGGGAPTLGALGLSSTSYITGQATGTVLATISGNTAGSTIAIEGSDTSNRFTVSGTNLLAGTAFAGTAAGSYNSGLTETLAGATNTPHTTTFTATLTGAGCSNSLNLTQACNSQYLAAGIIF